MQHMLMGPTWGIVAVVVVVGIVNLACWAAMLKMLLQPGERDPRHPKYAILRRDR